MRVAFSLRAILLLTVSGLTLMITLIACREVYLGWRNWEAIHALGKASLVSQSYFNGIEHLTRERELTVALLASGEEELDHHLAPKLAESRKSADADLRYIAAHVGVANVAPATEFASLQSLRHEIDHALTLPLTDRDPHLSQRWFDGSSLFIGGMFDRWMDFTRLYTEIDPIVTQRFMFQHFLGLIIRYSGRERALISGLIVSDRPIVPAERGLLLRWRGIIEQGWEMCARLSERSRLAPMISPALQDANSSYLSLYDMVENLFYIPGTTPKTPYPIDVKLWLEVSDGATESLNTVKLEAQRETQAYANQLERHATRAILFNMLVLAIALTLCGYSFWVVHYRVIEPVRRMIRALLDTADGKPVASSSPPVYTDDEIGQLAQVLYRFQKNTEQIHRTAATLERYTSDLERSNKELDDFAYIASHDLKEPLRGLHNHARFLLEDNEGKLEQDSVDRLHRLLYLSQRMEKLVNDLLYFSRLGRQQLAIQKTNLNEVVHDIEGMIDMFLQERHARIVLPAPLPELTCDKPRVTEALRNLITNAVKYNDKPEKVVEIGYLARHSLPGGKHATDVLYVKDNGLGIAPEFHDEIFRIFKRLQNSKGSEDGTGVGLTFVKKIVERHGGKIWLESEPGKGTIFYFTLRRLSDDADLL